MDVCSRPAVARPRQLAAGPGGAGRQPADRRRTGESGQVVRQQAVALSVVFSGRRSENCSAFSPSAASQLFTVNRVGLVSD